MAGDRHARRRGLTVLLAVGAVLAGVLVATPPALAAAEADLSVYASSAASVVTVGTAAVLRVDADGLGPDASGATTITVTPSGAAVALPSPGALGDAAATTCTKAGASLQCTNAGLGGDRPWSTSFLVPYTPSAAGALTFTVTIASSTPDPVPSNNSYARTLTSETAAESDVGVSLPWLGSPVRGGDILGDVTVSTWGPHASGQVSLHVEVAGAGGSLALPPGYDDGRGTTCTSTSTTMDCLVPSLSATGRWGQQARIPVAVTAAATGTLTLLATATGTTADPYLGSNTDTASAEVVEAPAATLGLTAGADQAQQCGGADAYRGLSVAGRLSSPTGDPAYRRLVVTAVPADASPTLTDETWTDAAGDYSGVLCGAATTTYSVTVRHPGLPEVGPATAQAQVVPRATTVAVVPVATTVVYGGQVVLAVAVRDALSAKVRDGASAVAVVERRAPGTPSWTAVAPVAEDVDAAGIWRPAFTATAIAEYRVRYPEQGIGALGAASTPVLVAVRAKATLAASPRIVTPGGRVTVTGTALPGSGAAPVLERLARGAWTAVGVRPVRTAGKATWVLPLASAGTTTYRVRVPGTSTLATGTSGTAALTATLKGKGNAKAYTFVGGTRANPARWNPCQVIGYRVNTRYARPGAVADVAETLRRITQYSGLRFRYAGSTSYLPGISRGASPAPLVIAWAPGRVDPSFQNPYLAGYASPTWYATSRPRIFRAGVMLNAGLSPAAGFGTGFTRGSLLMHEIGHAVGMGHVNDPWSIMIPVNNPPGDAMYSAGDATGLRLLGRSRGCLSSLELTDVAPTVTRTLR